MSERDQEMTEFLAGVVGVVEATTFEQNMLWDENRRRANPKTWKTINPGLLEVVGHLDDMPVCISLFKVEAGGDLLLFMHPTSQVVDHRMIDAWVEKTLPPTAYWRDGQINRADAMNFHNIFRPPVQNRPSMKVPG